MYALALCAQATVQLWMQTCVQSCSRRTARTTGQSCAQNAAVSWKSIRIFAQQQQEQPSHPACPAQAGILQGAASSCVCASQPPCRGIARSGPASCLPSWSWGSTQPSSGRGQLGHACPPWKSGSWQSVAMPHLSGAVGADRECRVAQAALYMSEQSA